MSPTVSRCSSTLRSPMTARWNGTTSLALHVTLRSADGPDGHASLLGDLAYETITKIFRYSEDHDRKERLARDVLLAPTTAAGK